MGWLDPFLDGAQQRLRDRLAKRCDGTGLPRELSRLPELAARRWPVHRVLRPAIQTAMLEFHVAQQRGNLPAPECQESWREFSTRLAGRQARCALWREYPVLVRYVIETYAGWADRCASFVDRLLADWPAIRGSGLVGPDPGELVDVTVADDMSRSVGIVRILHFKRSRLVYKPRSVTPDHGFSAVLDWFNEAGPIHQLRVPRVLDLGDHGWMEYISSAPCRDREQVDAFYWRAGVLTALVHLLRGLDVHAGNVVAAGEHPVLIDLETLLTPQPPADGGSAEELEAGMSSVLATGLVPSVALYRDEDGVLQPFDYSGFSDAAGRPAAVRNMVPARDEHGCPSLVTVRPVMPAYLNMPVLHGQRVPLVAHEDAFVTGFETALRVVAADKEGFRAGPLRQLSRARTRYIPRPVRVHLKLLAASLHPNLLRDGRDRSVLFERLWRTPSSGGGHPAIVSAEIEALHQGCVPDFSVPAEDRSLILPDGSSIADHWPVSPLNRVRHRLAGLAEPDIRRQVETLRQAIATVRPATARIPVPRRVTAAEPTRQQLRDAVHGLVHEVLQAVAPIGEEPSWLTLDLVDDRIWVQHLAQPGFHAGLSGIGFLLAHAGHLERIPEATRMAERIADRLARQARAMADGPEQDVGLGWGTAGIGYFLTALTDLAGDDRWLPALEDLCSRTTRALGDPVPADLIGGAAGSLLAALAGRPAVPDSLARAHLGAAEQALLRALTTPQPVAPAPPDASLFRGSSGHLLALGRLLDSGLADAPAAVEEAVSRLCQPDADRLPPAEAGGWGAGGVGVAAARLALVHCRLPAPVATRCREDLDRVRETMERAGFESDAVDVSDLSLHTGLLGRLEVLRQIAAYDRDEGLARRVRRALAVALEHGLTADWPGSAPGGAFHVGFVTGVCGTAFALLAAAHPDHLPDVLTFDVGRAIS
ncbi:type 2 lanthipeptide synthetase LanM family protein [Micromonospora sp. WMMD1102]|uniref:type 2 lanthipeptide synthetase LanM family protein n=1 Tax=Micromonospora sp. WMMD1102 TaxID=3016105 RepID=UPI00241570E0|nr:type 2 lanthipeptide synthetase LanM family protein [Micromonospora sp. WMMD1102]MDG4791773.1 type 2 lanthipeptide synthetase LanM family protein [Micromonospora sp. WMMD1102]